MQTQSFLQCAMIASLSLYSPAQSSVERAPALQDSTPLAVDPSSRVPQAEHFTDIQGVRESTGTLIVRLIRADQAAAYGLAPEQVEARRQAGKQIVAAYELLRATPETEEYVIRVPAEETDYSLAVKLMETGAFEYAEPNWTVYPVGTPNDSLYANQWHHSRIQSSGAWDINKGSREISCSILDTGVRTTHADLTARREGFNVSMNSWESGGGQISDLNGHGTMTAGVAAAKGNNNLGVSGVGWNLSFRPVRVSEQSNGSSTIDLLTAAVRTAADAGDKIISVSYSGVANAAVESAGAYARSRGALLIWAAGNSAENHQGDRNDNVFIVGATNSNDTLTSWSGRGPRLDMVAPGVDIFTTSNIGDNHYAASSGTSFSTPMVAGLAGLIWSRNPALTPAQVENILRTSADDLGAAGVDDMYGYGRMNSAAAIAMTPRASRTPYWATSVPETSSPASDVPWKNESFAGGPESCDSCNTTTCEYASNSSDLDVTPLVATDFECFTLPDNHFISKVEVEVSAVYNSGTSANLEIRAVLPSHYLDTGWRTTPTFVSGTRCAPRAGATGDITNLCNNWTADMVNNIQLQVRRPSGLSGNTLRIVSMKVMVTIQRI